MLDLYLVTSINFNLFIIIPLIKRAIYFFLEKGLNLILVPKIFDSVDKNNLIPLAFKKLPLRNTDQAGLMIDIKVLARKVANLLSNLKLL